jgi:hypothetical protein
MAWDNHPYPEVLAGEATLNEMMSEITRSCALVAWLAEDQLEKKFAEVTTGQPAMLRFNGMNLEAFWWSIHVHKKDEGVGISGISFYYDGYELGKWKNGQFKLISGTGAEKFESVPKIHSGLQVLFDGVRKSFPTMAYKLHTIAALGKLNKKKK